MKRGVRILDGQPLPPCTRCGETDLSAYRLLYHGRLRALLCRACEIATAPNADLAHYRRTFEHHAQVRKVAESRRAEGIRAYQAAWRAGHQDAIKAYKHAYYAENAAVVNRESMARYYADPEFWRAKSRARYARKVRANGYGPVQNARPRTEAARERARDQRRQQRAAWRRRFRVYVIHRVAVYYEMTPAAVQTGRGGEFAGEARQVACWLLLRCYHQPADEVAAALSLTVKGAKGLAAKLSRRLGHRHDALAEEAREMYAIMRTRLPQVRARFHREERAEMEQRRAAVAARLRFGPIERAVAS